MDYELGVVNYKHIGVNDPWIVRRLLKLGHVILDIKPRDDNGRTRFIFKGDASLAEDIASLREQHGAMMAGDSN